MCGIFRLQVLKEIKVISKAYCPLHSEFQDAKDPGNGCCKGGFRGQILKEYACVSLDFYFVALYLRTNECAVLPSTLTIESSVFYIILSYFQNWHLVLLLFWSVSITHNNSLIE